MFCFLHQWRLSRHLDSTGPLPGRTRRHLSRCPSCHTFRTRAAELAERLTEQAQQPGATVSPALHERILRRCRGPAADAAPEAAPGLFATLRPHLALAAVVAVALIVAAVVYWSLPKSDPGKTIVDPLPPPRESGDGEVVAAITPGRFAAGVNRAIDTIVEQPVRREIRRLGQDGQAAAQFLLACMPVDLQATPPPPPPPPR